MNRHDKVFAYRWNFYAWETYSIDRSLTYEIIDGMLSDKLDLVTIQLGENVTDFTHYEDDLVNLIEHIKSKAPKAQIIVIGDFWNGGCSEMRKKCSRKGTC